MAVSGQDIVVAYRENNNNIRDTYMAVSTDNGASFGNEVDIDQLGWQINGCPVTGPDIEILGDTVLATFMSSASGQSRVYYSKTSKSSGQGTAAIELTGWFMGLGIQNYPRLSVDNEFAAIAWQQSVSGSNEIAVSLTADIDTGFPTYFEVPNANNARNPDIILDGNVVHVVWRDLSTGSVKYRRGTVSAASLDNFELTNVVPVKFLDLMGRETIYTSNTPLIAVYSDGTTRKVINFE